MRVCVCQRGVDSDQFGSVVFIEDASLTSFDKVRCVGVLITLTVGNECSAGSANSGAAHLDIQRAAIRKVYVSVVAMWEQR